MTRKPIAPMLAVPMTKANIIDWNDWVAEPKYDGHRLVIDISANGDVVAHTRERKRANVTGKSQATRELPTHLIAELRHFKGCTLDCELLAGCKNATATDVTRLDLASTLFVTVFDLLMSPQGSTMMLTCEQRRAALESTFTVVQMTHGMLPNVQLARRISLTSQEDLLAFVEDIWANDGEGAILKYRFGRYMPGKRSPDYVKVKRIEHGVGVITGFEATRGAVMNRGQFAVVKLHTDDGYDLTLKTPDDEHLELFARTNCIGRRVMFDYPFRTRDGNYQGPIIWDRFEDE